MDKSYYFDPKNLEVNQAGRGIKVHPLIALALATMVGGLFVVFLPFIGLYLTAKFIVMKMAEGLKPVFAPAPMALGEAHLTGTPGNGEEGNSLEDLKNEIDSKRS